MSTRRGILGTMTAGAAMMAVREISQAKTPPTPRAGGFGATASVSVNSGNNSGNQTFQENQAILTDNGSVSLNQGNASGSAQIQQVSAVESLPATGGGGCPAPDFSHCQQLQLCLDGNASKIYVPLDCVLAATGS